MAWIVVSIFTALTLLAASRLLSLWRRTRQLPELLIAVLIVGVGTIAVGLGFLLQPLVSPVVAHLLPQAGASAGLAALALFNWQVYRPRSAVGRAGFVGTALGLSIVLAGSFASPSFAAEPIALAWTRSALYVGIMAWSALESLHYWGRMRRRLALGLADRVVTNRVLLWGLATGISALGILIGAIGQLALGVRPHEANWVTLVYAAHGSVGATCFWLAFAPPKPYLRWLRSRTPEAV